MLSEINLVIGSSVNINADSTVINGDRKYVRNHVTRWWRQQVRGRTVSAQAQWNVVDLAHSADDFDVRSMEVDS